MKKFVILAVVVLLAAGNIWAKEAFFASQPGMVLTTANLDPNSKGKKGKKANKVESYTRLTVKDVEGSDGNMTVMYTVEGLDAKKQSYHTDGSQLPEYKLEIVDGYVEMDMRRFVGGSEGGAVTLTGDDRVRVPMTMSAGERFKDVKMTMTIDMGSFKTVTDIMSTGHMCVAVESITTPAGTFEAYKTTQMVETVTKIGITIRTVSTTETWHVRGIGPVQTFSYNRKGKLTGWTQLHEIKR